MSFKLKHGLKLKVIYDFKSTDLPVDSVITLYKTDKDGYYNFIVDKTGYKFKSFIGEFFLQSDKFKLHKLTDYKSARGNIPER